VAVLGNNRSASTPQPSTARFLDAGQPIMLLRTVSGSVRHRGPARASAALSPAVSARSRDARCPVVLGQACHLLVEPLDSPPQGGVLPGLPLDLPPQGFDLFGVPPLFLLVLHGQPPQGPRQLPL